MAKTLDEKELNGVNGGTDSTPSPKYIICPKCGSVKRFDFVSGTTYKCHTCGTYAEIN